MVAPINSIKHYVHSATFTVASGVRASIVVVDAVAAPANATSLQVLEGSIVKAIYLEYWVTGDDVSGTVSQFLLAIEKAPSNVSAMSATNATNLGAYTNKKNIFYTTQGILNSSIDSGSVPVIRQWILIPKGKQRMGLGDRLVVTLNAVGKLRACGIATYKEYR